MAEEQAGGFSAKALTDLQSPSASDLAEMGKRLSGEVLMPESPGYEPWRRPANPRFHHIGAWQEWAPDARDEVFAVLRISAPGDLGEPPRVTVVGVVLGNVSETEDHLGEFVEWCGSQPTHRSLEAFEAGGGLKRSVTKIDSDGVVVAATSAPSTASRSSSAGRSLQPRLTLCCVAS